MNKLQTIPNICRTSQVEAFTFLNGKTLKEQTHIKKSLIFLYFLRNQSSDQPSTLRKPNTEGKKRRTTDTFDSAVVSGKWEGWKRETESEEKDKSGGGRRAHCIASSRYSLLSERTFAPSPLLFSSFCNMRLTGL